MVQSLRDLGYEFSTAVADLIDNSLTAGAANVRVDITFHGRDSWVRVADDGSGMSDERLTEALRYGSEETYGPRDLGKFGLGLKTASMSQCRRLTVSSRVRGGGVAVRCLDLDHVSDRNRWEVTEPQRVDSRLDIPSNGTVVLWQKLDRVMQYKDPESEWARAGLRNLADRTDRHLGMVFHRFLDGSATRAKPLSITMNGTAVDAWDPFARDQTCTEEFNRGEALVATSSAIAPVNYVGYVLPTREQFSSQLAFRRAAGPKKWNRQQGFYIYRADRMIQSGGWSGMRTIDEHTKLARMSLDFLPELDPAFGINVAKVRVTLPPELREVLAEPVGSLVKRAQLVYRDKETVAIGKPSRSRGTANGQRTEFKEGGPMIGVALETAAVKVGQEDALAKIASQVRLDSPEVARDIGW